MADRSKKPSKLPGPQLTRAEIQFDPKDVLGSGSYSVVYLGKCRETTVAVKRNTTKVDRKTLKVLEAEIAAMRENPHPNILQYLGVCAEEKGEILIVTEYCPGGDLDTLLHEKSDVYLTTSLRMEWAADIAKGLAWIHATGYIHRDLKPANVFLTENQTVKIGDFGFALKDTQQNKKGNFKGSALWMAPEKLTKVGETKKTDVYAYGIMLWELLTRNDPFRNHNDLDEFTTAIVEEHERPPIPEYCPDSLRQLLVCCWAHDPEHRPNADEIPGHFPEIQIDVSIKESKGRRFWKKYFQTSLTVPFDTLIDKLFHYVGYEPSSTDRVRTYIYTSFPEPDGKNVSVQQFGHFLRWFGPISPNLKIIQRVKSVFEKDWFWGQINSKEAQTWLSSQPDGTYLVRFSSQPQNYGQFTLSRVKNGAVAHLRIQYTASTRQYTDSIGRVFKSIDDVLLHDTALVAPLQELGSIARFRSPDGGATQYLTLDQVKEELGEQVVQKRKGSRRKSNKKKSSDD